MGGNSAVCIVRDIRTVDAKSKIGKELSYAYDLPPGGLGKILGEDKQALF